MSFERAQNANMSCEATSDVERGARRVPGELNGTNLGFEKVRPSGLTEDERQRTARTVRFGLHVQRAKGLRVLSQGSPDCLGFDIRRDTWDRGNRGNSRVPTPTTGLTKRRHTSTRMLVNRRKMHVRTWHSTFSLLNLRSVLAPKHS